MRVYRIDKESGKWKKFCPQCGRQTEEFIGSICPECFLRTIVLIDPKAIRVNLKLCKSCGTYFWGGEKTSIEDAVINTVKRELRRRYGDIRCDVEVIAIEEKRARVRIKAELKGVIAEQTGEIRLDIKTGSCDRCSRIAGGYYVAIVQVRAQNRLPTDNELKSASEIAQSVLEEPEFIAKQRILKQGLDIYVSSMKYGRKLSWAIVKQLGGSFTESRKLYGRKDGRNIYRFSFSVRLPGFQEGAKARIDGREISVVRVAKGRGIEYVDLNTGEHEFLKMQDTKKLQAISFY